MFKKLLIGLGVVFLLVIVIGAMSGGGDTGEPDNAATQAEDGPSEEPTEAEKKVSGTEDEVDERDEAGPMTVGNWEVIGKIVPKAESFTGDFTTTFRVKNTSDAADTGMFTVNVLKGDNIWASMDCAGPEVSPGQVGTVDCISTDKFRKGWSDITIENMF